MIYYADTECPRIENTGTGTVIDLDTRYHGRNKPTLHVYFEQIPSGDVPLAAGGAGTSLEGELDVEHVKGLHQALGKWLDKRAGICTCCGSKK